MSLGCCLPALLIGSSHHSLLEPILWQWCMQDGPGQHCTQCSGAKASSVSAVTGLLVVATLTGKLILI